MKRRDFLQQSAILAAGLGLGYTGPLSGTRLIAQPPFRPGADPALRDLLLHAIDAAIRAGASYADARINRNRNQAVSTRERQVTGLSDTDTMGVGIRVIAGGAWGFAATRELSEEEIERTARHAVAQARGNARARRSAVELAPAAVEPDGRWSTPIEVDPFDIAIEEKVDLLLRANEAALMVEGAAFVTSSIFSVREEKLFASSEGTFTDQTAYRIWPLMNITAVSPDRSDFQSRTNTPVQPMGLGWEYVTAADLVGNATEWAEDAVAKLSARTVQPGRYDLVLLPSHLFLTIHESVAHPTELDRIRGFEANYAGTSFIDPVEDYLGKFRYGPEIMQIQGERSARGGLSTIGWDDEGVRPDEYLIVKDGVLNDLQTTREQAPWLAEWYRSQGREVRSHGNSYAQSWADVQFQRMPNVNLLPHPERDVELDELVAGVENGILIEGRGSYSIDQQRYNAQFGGQVFHEIRNGRVGGMLKDVAYQIRTPEFWNSMDLIGGPSTYELGGTFNDGKGQPSQSNAVSHGCPPARFRQVNVINTGRSA
ncbi:MAG TPA: TldD/PmbA family protein [Longimicrobiales bacterium]|nr:TldD/PmbA family protein [Longimicrobiales bacterium]